MSKQYQALADRRAFHREDKSCTVICLGMLLGTSYEDAWNKCKDFGRVPRKGFNLMAKFPEISEKSGLTITPLGRMAKSVKAFQRLHLRGKYIIHTKKHILYYEDGTIHDWSDDRALHVVNIYKVSGDVNPDYIDPTCDTLSHDYYTRTKLATTKRTRNSRVKWKMIKMECGTVVAEYKRKPTAKIEALVEGRLSLRNDRNARLAIRSVKAAGKATTYYEAPPVGTTVRTLPVAIQRW